MRGDPFRERIPPTCLCICKGGRDPDANESLRLADFTSCPIENPNPRVRVLDEKLVSSAMTQAHHRRQASPEFLKQLTKPAVSKSRGMLVTVLLPELLKIDPWALQFAARFAAYWLRWVPNSLLVAAAGKQPFFNHRIGQLVWQRPRQSRFLRAPQNLLWLPPVMQEVSEPVRM